MRVVGVVVADEMSVLVVVVVADERMRWRGEVMKWLTNVVVPWVKSGRDRKKKEDRFALVRHTLRDHEKQKVRKSRSHISFLIERMWAMVVDRRHDSLFNCHVLQTKNGSLMGQRVGSFVIESYIGGISSNQ